MGKSKDLATGSAYVDASGDTMTGDLVLDKQTATSQDAILNSVKFVNGYASPNYIASIDAYKGYYDNNIGFKFNTQVGGAGGSAVSLDAMTIDASGRVTMPYQPAASVSIRDHNTSQTYAGAGVSELYIDPANSDFVRGISLSSDRLTVPVSGLYYVSAWQLNISNGGEYLRIEVNGTVLAYFYVNNTAYDTFTVSKLLNLSANDYIQISYSSNTSSRWEGTHSDLSVLFLG